MIVVRLVADASLFVISSAAPGLARRMMSAHRSERLTLWGIPQPVSSKQRNASTATADACREYRMPPILCGSVPNFKPTPPDGRRRLGRVIMGGRIARRGASRPTTEKKGLPGASGRNY